MVDNWQLEKYQGKISGYFVVYGVNYDTITSKYSSIIIERVSDVPRDFTTMQFFNWDRGKVELYRIGFKDWRDLFSVSYEDVSYQAFVDKFGARKLYYAPIAVEE